MAGIYHKHDDDGHHVVFRCTVANGSEPVPSSDEVSDCAFWNPGELPRPMSDSTIRRIRDALAEKRPCHLVEVPALNWLE